MLAWVAAAGGCGWFGVELFFFACERLSYVSASTLFAKPSLVCSPLFASHTRLRKFSLLLIPVTDLHFFFLFSFTVLVSSPTPPFPCRLF
jgi:hypothetical protein